MTMNNPLATLQAFSPTAQGITNQVQAGSNVLTQGLQQDLLRQTIQGNEQAALAQQQALQSQSNIQNTAGNLVRLNTAIAQGADENQLAALLQQNIARAQAQGGNGADSQEALQVLQTGGLEALRNLAGQTTAVFEQQGILTPPPKAESAFAKIDPSKFTAESVATFQDSGKFGDLMPISTADTDPVFIGELRKELRTETGTLQKQAGVLKSNFEKLQNLTSEINNGNRSAVAQALVSLVKLGDPTSVVKDSEMEAALNAENPLAALSSALQGTDPETSGIITSLVRKIDPLSPETVNTDELLATANAMLTPNVNTIVGAYDTAKSRAGEQLTEGDSILYLAKLEMSYSRLYGD